MSQKEAQTERIGDHDYEMFMLAPMRSHGLLMDVAKMVGPALGSAVGALVGGDAKDIMEREVTPDLLSTALGKLFLDLNKKTLEDVIRAFSEVTFVDGKPLTKIFDDHFHGALEDLYRWLAWGFKVQWGKSLGALVSGTGGRGALSALMQLGASRSPSTSTGSSGGQS